MDESLLTLILLVIINCRLMVAVRHVSLAHVGPYVLNKNCQKTGLGIILKVMAGDQFNIRVSSWYKKNGTTPNNTNTIISDLVADMINNLTSPGALLHGNITATQLSNSGVISGSATSFLNTQPAPGTTKPKAYLNWVLLDEQFKFVDSSGAEQVGNDQEFKVHTKNNMPISKNGYLYVYVSNETSNIDVYFDNLQVTHIKGAILEETHYYPFGLTMTGISSKAFGGIENKFGITSKEKQSKEFNDGSGIELYDFGARMQDPQLGRWHVVDPLVSNYYWLSPYNYCNNNPIKYLDPNGMEFKDTAIGGKEGRYDVATLDNVTIVGKSKKSTSLISYRTQMADYWILKKDLYGQARYDGWSQSQMFDAWSKQGVKKSDLEIYEKRYQRMMNFRNVQLVTVGSLGAPILATAAPGMFAVSADLALPKMALSFGIQSFFNGIENVDYFDVAADGFTAPGLNATLNGSVDFRPFGKKDGLKLIGYNKSLSQFGADAGAAFVGGSIGHATWEPLTPFLNNGLERSLFYVATQSWISSATQGATNIMTNEK